MRYRYTVALVLILGLAAVAWAKIADWEWDIAKLTATMTETGIEIRVDQAGTVKEIEYNLPLSKKDLVPKKVLTKMAGLYSTPLTAIEKEREGGTVYWELSTVVGGKKHEVRFLEDGEPQRFEIEIDAPPTNPVDIAAKLEALHPGPKEGLTWEKVVEGPDDKGPATAYHAKFKKDGKRHKVVLDAEGREVGVWYEIAAELEVPAK